MSIPVALSDGSILHVPIINSRRVKRIRIVANINGIHAIVPIKYNIDDLEHFINSKKSWIQHNSKYYLDLREKIGQAVFCENTVFYLGNQYSFRIVKDYYEYVNLSENLKLITFHVIDKRKYKKSIKEWYRHQTEQIISTRLKVFGYRLGLEYNKFRIKDQKSRWASCSRNRNLNFSLFLAAVPPEVIDYVIIHELIHLIELNHSSRFWTLVEKADPEYKKHRDWLAKYGALVRIK